MGANELAPMYLNTHGLFRRIKMEYPVNPPFRPPSSPSRPDKVIMQRQYREKEGECFNKLRDVVKEVTGEELQTRQEILRKAIDLLSTVSETRKLRTTEIVPHEVLYGMSPSANTTNATMAQFHSGYSTQPPQSHKTWPTSVGFDAQSAYHTAQFHGQQYTSCPAWGLL